MEQTTQESPQQDVQNSSAVFPYFTLVLGILCVIATFGSWYMETYELWDYYEFCGYSDAYSIWGGAYWAYITSCFVHIDIVHLVLNLYVLFILGKAMELEIGWRKMCLFFLCSAFVSSGFEFIFSKDTGVGISGVLYGLVGYIWIARHKSILFEQTLTPRFYKQLIGWFLFGFVLTKYGGWNIGNIAHLSGLLFGFAAASAFVMKRRQAICIAGLVAGFILAVVPMFWFPTSADWLIFKGDEAYESKLYNEAIGWYSKAIKRDPEDAWAYYSRSLAYEELGDRLNARLDLWEAYRLDPSLEDEEESQEDSEAKD